MKTTENGTKSYMMLYKADRVTYKRVIALSPFQLVYGVENALQLHL